MVILLSRFFCIFSSYVWYLVDVNVLCRVWSTLSTTSFYFFSICDASNGDAPIVSCFGRPKSQLLPAMFGIKRW